MTGSGQGDAPAGGARQSAGPVGTEERAAYEGFSLALRVMYLLYAPEVPATEVDRPWEVAREIAEGKLSMSNPGDLASRFPDMRDFVFDRANDVVHRERQIALAVLKGMQEAL